MKSIYPRNYIYISCLYNHSSSDHVSLKGDLRNSLSFTVTKSEIEKNRKRKTEYCANRTYLRLNFTTQKEAVGESKCSANTSVATTVAFNQNHQLQIHECNVTC